MQASEGGGTRKGRKRHAGHYGGFDRTVQAPPETARRTVLEAVQRMGFHIDVSQGAAIKAHRGSVARFAIGRGKRPLCFSGLVTREGGTSKVYVELADGEQIPFDPQKATSVYAAQFAEIGQQLDAWLQALDASLVPEPLPPIQVHPEHQPTPTKALGQVLKHVPGLGPLATTALHLDVHLWIFAPDAEAVMTPDQAQMALAVASLIVGDANALPPTNRRRRLERLTRALRRALEDARPPAARLDVTAADRAGLDFLYQQALIRKSLPVRELHRCRDCQNERIVNPDYQKRIASNGLLRETVGMAGMTLGPAGVNPFLAVGRLLNLGLLKPAGIACRRCEGTDIDVALVTICPKCHSIRPETVLRRCPQRGCNYDYLARAAGASLWADSAPQPAPAVEAPSVCEDVPAGWYPDPSGRHRLRWFHDEWTAWAADAGGPIEDPLNPTVSAAVR